MRQTSKTSPNIMFSQFIQPKKEGMGYSGDQWSYLPYAIHIVELSAPPKTWELLVAKAG